MTNPPRKSEVEARRASEDIPRNAQARRTRDAILIAARKLFSEASYDCVSLKDIAAGAGVSQGPLFHHFKSKAAIWQAAMGTAPPLDKPGARHATDLERLLGALIEAYRLGDRALLESRLTEAEAALARIPAPPGTGMS